MSRRHSGEGKIRICSIGFMVTSSGDSGGVGKSCDGYGLCESALTASRRSENAGSGESVGAGVGVADRS